MVEANKTDKVSKRVNLACHYCRRRKKKCDGNRPTCSNCAAVGEQCVYQSKGTQSKTNVRFDKLKSQMDRMEYMIARIAESQNPEYRVMPSDSDSSIYSVGSTGGEERTIDFAEQNESLKGSIEDEQAGELPDFNDRLEQLMLNQTAGNLDSLMYTSGIFLSILSPNEVESLSRKMHNPNTIIWLSKTSNLIWRLQQRSMMMLVEVSDQEIDSEFAQFCMGLHRQVLSDLSTRFGSDFRKKFIPASLISKDDIAPGQFSNWPVHLRRGIIAALVLEGAVILKLSAPNKRTRWSDEYISKQERIAFHHCINLLNIVKFSRPSYMLAKTCSFIICHVSKFFCVPAILAFLDSMLDLARSLALNSEAVNSKLPEAKAKERLYLWDIIIRGYNQQMICRLSTLKIGDIPFIKSWGSEFDSGNDGLKNIYLRCRKKLFGLYKNRTVPRSDIHKEIVRSGAELDEWWNNWCEKKKFTHIATDNTNTTSKSKKRRGTANSSERSQSGSSKSDEPSFVVGLATNEYIDIVIKSFHIQLYREYLLTKLIIYSIPAFYPQYLPESVPNALEIVRQIARDLLMLAVDETKSIGVCYDAMTLCTTAAIGALLFKQLKHPENPTNKDDIEFLKCNLPLLNAESWPSVVDGKSAMMELWTALLHIMVKVYEFKGLPPSDNSEPTIVPGSIGSNSTDSNSSQSLLHQTPSGSASSLQFANYIHNQQQQQQRPQNIMHSAIGQIQNVPSANYYEHGAPAADSMMRRERGYANRPQFVKNEAEMTGSGGLASPNSSGSTPSVASNGSYMSVQSVLSPPVPVPMTHAHTFPTGSHSTSDTINTREMLPQHINRRFSVPRDTPMNMGFQNIGTGRDDYTSDHQHEAYGAQFPSRSSTSSFGSYMPTVEEQPRNEIHPGQEIYDFESMVDNNPDLILRDVEQPENCSIS